MFKGRIRGFSHAPFARNGPGWLHKPARVQHPDQTKPPRPACILKGHWVNDELITKNAELVASDNGDMDPSRVFAKDVTECRACLSVFQRAWTRAHVCLAQRENTSSPRPRAKVKASKAGGSTPNTQKPDDTCVIVGLNDGVAEAFVLQRLSFSDGSRLGGGAGARCFASFDTKGNGRSVCFSATCRNAIMCSLRDTCPHIESIKNKIEDASSTVSSGLGLDAFLALTTDEPADLRPRRCRAQFCSDRAPSMTKAEATKDAAAAPAGSNAAADQGGGGGNDGGGEGRSGGHVGGDVQEVAGAKRAAEDESEGEEDYDNSEDEDARTVQLEEQDCVTAYGYTPKVDEILRMSPSQLRALCDQLSFDARTCPQLLQYTLVEYYHPEAVSTLPQKLKDAKDAASNSRKTPAPPRKRKRLKKVEKVGGAVGRAPDADTATRLQDFRYAERARRCVKGSMCMEHAAQKVLAVQWHEELDAVDLDSEELQPSTTDDGQKQLEPTPTSAEADAAPAPHCDTSADAGGAGGEVSVAELCASLCDTCNPTTDAAFEAIVDGRALPVAMAAAMDVSHTVPNALDSATTTWAQSIKSMKLRRVGAPCESPSCADPSCGTAACGTAATASRSTNPSEPPAVAHHSTTTAPSAAGPKAIPDDVPATETQSPFPTKTRTKLHLTPTMVDDFLYSITLAKARSTQPVIPIASNHYAVLRSEANECSYSCPGGYSIVKAVLREDPDRRGSSVLSLSCNCSEYRSCRSGMGGRSKKGSARFCTCCAMVVAANILDAPVERVANGDSAWLIAGRRHGKVHFVAFPSTHAPRHIAAHSLALPSRSVTRGRNRQLTF